MSNPHDTQFAGYAALLLKEIDDEIKVMTSEDVTEQEVAQRLGTILARRAYDLVWHAFGNIEVDPIGQSDEFMMANIPDMTTWPEEEK